MEKVFIMLILGIVAFSIVSILLDTYNRMVRLKYTVDKSYSNIAVLMKQRVDEIPNLVKILKEHQKYEASLLKDITNIRTNFYNGNNPEDKVREFNKLNSTFYKMLINVENYPELKVSNSFTALKERVSKIEDIISDRREYYNESVTNYNIGIVQFPNILIKFLLSWKSKELLKITDLETTYNGINF